MKVIAITGKPCSGKSTITDIFSDIGIDTVDTGDVVRSSAQDALDDPDEDDIWEWVSVKRSEIGSHAPTKIAVEEVDISSDIVAISGMRNQSEIDWLRSEFDDVIVLKVSAHSYHRTQRYVDKKLEESDESRDVVSSARIFELRQQLYDREDRESPYPDHDIVVENDNSVSVHEIYDRMENLLQFAGWQKT